MVMEYCSKGSLYDILHGRNKSNLTWPTKLSIALNIAKGMRYLHANNVLHRDLKTGNIVLDENFKAKIVDCKYTEIFPYINI